MGGLPIGSTPEEEDKRWEEEPTPAGNGQWRYNPLGPRLTVVETVYYQPGERGVEESVESRYSVLLTKDDQPYKRRLKIEKGEQWNPLDTAWIREISLLHVTNEEKPETKIQLEIAFLNNDMFPCLLLPPRESFRIRPGRSMFIRSPQGDAWITITAFPA